MSKIQYGYSSKFFFLVVLAYASKLLLPSKVLSSPLPFPEITQSSIDTGLVACYIQTENGQFFNLTAFCGKGFISSTPTPVIKEPPPIIGPIITPNSPDALKDSEKSEK